MISVSEYRKILNDEITSDELIKKRIKYIEAFCRNIIKFEFEQYVKETKQKRKL